MASTEALVHISRVEHLMVHSELLVVTSSDCVMYDNLYCGMYLLVYGRVSAIRQQM